jgi:lysophospholipid hydrolase
MVPRPRPRGRPRGRPRPRPLVTNLTPGSDNPTRGLRKWRRCRPEVVRHHPLRLGSEEDLQRLARHIAGHAVGVVLTGGGGHGLVGMSR